MSQNRPSTGQALAGGFAAIASQGPGTIAQWAAIIGALCAARYGAALGDAVQSTIIAAAALVVALVTHERHATHRAKVHRDVAETNAAGAIAAQKAAESAERAIAIHAAAELAKEPPR